MHINFKVMDNKYQNEIDEFCEKFHKYKKNNIVLYGIGRYTATIIEGVKEFHFVGLMDKDPLNQGKEIFGLPIVDSETAEQIADLVIINTSETYWDVIFDRIKNISIPVFYKNGNLAELKKERSLNYPYYDLSKRELLEKIDRVDVVTFDFFDTLFMRRVCNPRDIFTFLECDICNLWNSSHLFSEIRNNAIRALDINYSLDDLYQKMEEISGLNHELLSSVREKEIALEKRMLIPRKEVLEIFRKLIDIGKPVYIISDMYLGSDFYMDVLKQYGLKVDRENIFISSEMKLSKRQNNIWEYVTKNHIGSKIALHIGDDLKYDIENPKKSGIETYLTPNPWNILMNSSMQVLGDKICKTYDSAIMGCVLSKLCNNPYVIKGKDGIFEIKKNYDMGYIVFGPVILTFLLWILQQGKTDNIEKFVFMSRDGYFLQEDFQYLCQQKNENIRNCYIGISRQLAMSASIQSKEDVMEYMSMPYTGSTKDLFEDRLGIEIIENNQYKIYDYVEQYEKEIKESLTYLRKNYLVYLENMKLNNQSAIVDLGYYGNNQKFLNKLIHRKMKGYYFNANLSTKNENVNDNMMSACFQTKEDETGEQSQVYKKMIFVESVLTAPYGMIKGINERGEFIHAEKKQNQLHFDSKIEINNGIKGFIYDFMKCFGDYEIDLNPEFVDQYYGYCMGGALKFSEEVKQSFYNDNAMMNRLESMLFY